MAKNEIPQQAIAHIGERPKHLDLYVNIKGEKTRKYMQIYQTLLLLESSKAYIFDTLEFQEEFGEDLKKEINNMRIWFKKNVKEKVCVTEDQGKVYMWLRKDIGGANLKP